MESKRPTLKDLALETGVSKQSISLILNGSRKYPYSEETTRKVFEATKRLGYKANRAAQSVRKGCFNTIGLLLKNDEFWIDLPKPVIKGVEDVFRKENYNTVHIKLKAESFNKIGVESGFMSENMIDGLIIGYENDSLATPCGTIEDSRAPIIWVNRKVDYNSVRPDDESAARKITEILLDLGHRRILYANYSHTDHYSSTDRLLSYEKTMIKAGLTPWTFCGYVPREKRIEKSREFLDRADRPTAIIAYGGTTALPFMLSFTDLYGLKIPEQLSIVSFGGPVDDSTGLALSTIEYNEETIGRESAKMLLRRILSGGAPEPSIVVTPSKILGNTCAQAPVVT